MTGMKYHIITYGCQANQSNSERISGLLEAKGHKPSKEKGADLIIVNVCSVRENAVQRALGRIKSIKNKKILLTGCILKQDRERMEKYAEIKEFDDLFKKTKVKNPRGFVPIMEGCDNFCSYCVVPFTRGREKYRNQKEILKEVKNLLKKGLKEITLLGQNVASYPRFEFLIRKINALPGDFRISFLTSHPRDFSDELIKAIKESKKVKRFIHLPVQSGDDLILKKMNRQYIRKQYLELIEKIRKEIPEIQISTDVIVGFPQETKKQFQNTVDLFKKASFDNAYVSCYSPRPGTAAFKMKDNVPLKEKQRRAEILRKLVRSKKQSKIIAILGPTSSGKSGLAVKMAQKFRAEIISADSRQIYKGMDIGTGKITRKEMQGIPHYLLSIASPKKRFSVIEYRNLARKALEKIFSRNKTAIITGGTGFYVQALLDGIIIPEVKPDWNLRKKLEKMETAELFSKLKKLDPQRAETIESKNRRRLVRALEIVIKTRKPVPSLKAEPLPFPVLRIGLKKEGLKKLIRQRLKKRLEQGLIKEVEKLKKSLSWKRLDEFGLEYRYVSQYLKKELSYQQMFEALSSQIWQYSKRQITWLKKDKGILWAKSEKEAMVLAEKFLKS
jgi:tRNA dimethylallyltransferase